MGLTEAEQEAINSSSAHPAGNPLNLRSWNRPPSKVADRLWIGNLYDSFNHVLMTKLRIGAVVNVMGSMFNLGIVQGLDPQPVCCVPEGIGYACFKTLQPFGQTIGQAKAAIEAIKFYKDQIGVNVLVHCGEGIDRAPTIVCKYMVETQNITWEVAEKMIKDARPIAVPHQSWWN